MPPKKGVCIDCRGQTWSAASAIRCRTCARTGALNPAWGKFTSTKKAQGQDRARRRFSLGVCQRCQKKPAIDRHHRDGNPLNNESENVQNLCRRCHMIEDGRLLALLKHSYKKQDV